MKQLLLAVAVSCSFFACPKEAPASDLGGSDGEKMDTIASKLEEYRTRTELECSETCSIKGKVCGLSGTACDIAGKHADRGDFQERCVASQEDCARFSESCSTCSK